MQQQELFKAYEEIKEGIDNAPNSNVPFPVVKDEKMSVIGDANETQINKHDFKILFRLPEGISDGEKVEGGVLKEVEYKDVFITPRQSGKVVSALCRMLPFFRKMIDKGVGEYTHEDVVEMLAEFGDDFVDDMYDLVGKTLQIDDALIDYMMPASAVQATVKIVTEYPEIVNEAEAFFS